MPYLISDTIMTTDGSSQSGSETIVAKIDKVWFWQYPGSAAQGLVTIPNFVYFSAQGKLPCTSKQKRVSFYRAYKYVSHTKVSDLCPKQKIFHQSIQNQAMPGLVSIFRTIAQLLA